MSELDNKNLALSAFSLDEDRKREILDQRAAMLARPAELSALLAHELGQIVCFRCGESFYGLELHHLSDIRIVERIAVIPNTPRFVLGLVQVHGDITAVIDLVTFFGFRRPEALPRPTTVLVSEVSGRSIAIACDELLDVQSLKEVDVVPVPAAVNRTEREVCRGIAPVPDLAVEGKALIIDAQALVGHPRVRVGQ